MNAYDFDKTIFYPDSSFCFVRFCLRHYPRAVLSSAPAASAAAALHLAKKADTKELKEAVFSFLPLLDDVERIVAEFWEAYRKNLQPWYLAQKRPDDLILSASPEFLLRPICDELGVRLIATDMDPNTGRIHGLNCHDEEKVRRFYLHYPDELIDDFYSDSFSDEPMARIARRAFWVNRGQPQPWPNL